MSSFGHSLFGFIIAIAILVTVHEYGHFWVARRLGVKVLRFSIGFGKSIVSWRRAGDPTEYSIGLIPLGGYVKMLDEGEGEVAPAERGMAFNRQSLAARSAIVFAGPASNFLFALLAIWLTLVIGGDDSEPRVGAVAENSVAQAAGFRAGDRIARIDGREVRAWGQHRFYLLHQAMKGNVVDFAVVGEDGAGRRLQVDFDALDQYTIGDRLVSDRIGLQPPLPPAVVSRLLANSPASRAGLQPGDRILAIDGQPIDHWGDLVAAVRSRPRQSITLLIQRAGAGGDAGQAENQQLELEVTTDAVTVGAETHGRLGLHRPPAERIPLRYGPLAAIPAALDQNWRMAMVTLRSLGRMLSARMSTDNLSGPITIARLAGRTIESSASDFLKFLAIISLSLGLLNLLPIPLLDGGHLLYFAIEAVTGRPPSPKTRLRGQWLGIAALILLMSVAFYNDIMRLF